MRRLTTLIALGLMTIYLSGLFGPEVDLPAMLWPWPEPPTLAWRFALFAVTLTTAYLLFRGGVCKRRKPLNRENAR